MNPPLVSGGYRLVERGTGGQLAATADREHAFELLRDAQAAGWGWDDLDVLDPDGRSLMLREHERAIDRVTLPTSRMPAFYRSLEETKTADGWVILDGDWGGQCYVTIPARLVRTDEAGLDVLIHEIDAEAWGGQEEGSLSLTYRSGSVGQGISGGMGGGRLERGPWVHPELAQLGWTEAIARVLSGELDHLPVPQTVLTDRQRDDLARALDDEDPRLRGFLAGPYRELPEVEWDIIEELLGPPPLDAPRWYHQTIYRALQNLRPDTSGPTLRRWRDERDRWNGERQGTVGTDGSG